MSLPPGLTLSPGGLLSGIPTTAGVFSFMVNVTDSVGATASAPMQITVMPALSLTITGVPGAVAGQQFTFQVTPTGGTPPFALTAS